MQLLGVLTTLFFFYQEENELVFGMSPLTDCQMQSGQL